LWSPAGAKVAYVVPAGSSLELRLVPAGGGKSRALVPANVESVFGWSPDGRYIAFETGTGSKGELAVVDVATRKVRSLLQFSGPTVAWAPSSQELVASTVSPKGKKCWSTWTVPAGGAKPTRISTCS